jgi:hypothetical protein
MNPNELPILVLPTDLDDQAAAALLECLYDAARLLENHYAAQLRRHHHLHDERQQPLWPDDQPPF